MTKKIIVEQLVRKSSLKYSKSLSDFIKDLEELQSLYPERDLLIDIDSHMDYDDSSPIVKIYFRREETDKEKEKREANNKYWEDRRIADAKKLLGIT